MSALPWALREAVVLLNKECSFSARRVRDKIVFYLQGKGRMFPLTKGDKSAMQNFCISC
jgi:hypothetical protein